MTLSSNYNGKVYKTSSTGYSVKATFSRLYDFLRSVDAIINDVSVAKTGSSYIDFCLNGIDYTVRISNHTKRTSNDYEAPTNYVEVVERDVYIDMFNKELGTELYKSCDFEILNTESKKAFFLHIGIK